MTDQSGPQPVVTQRDLDNDTGIDFLRSTTTTKVDREADGDTVTTVEHTARFAIRPGAVPDMTHKYGSQTFAPQFATVNWLNGRLSGIHVRGQRRLRSGQLQGDGHQSSRNYDWSSWDIEKGRGTPVPEALAQAITAYETMTAIHASGGDR